VAFGQNHIASSSRECRDIASDDRSLFLGKNDHCSPSSNTLSKPVLEKKLCTTICQIVIRKLTVCGTRELLAERIIPTGIMARYYATSHSH